MIQPANKKQTIKNPDIFEQASQVLVVLTGGMTKGADGRWHTVGYDQTPGPFSVPGERLRLQAVYELYKRDPQSFIIISGGRGILEKIGDATVPPVSEVMRDELKILGVPPEKIILDTATANTFQQLSGLADRASAISGKPVKLISNDWHVPRITAFLEFNSDLREIAHSLDLALVSAEAVMVQADPDYWQPVIDRAYQSEQVKKMIESEKRGVADIKSGRYQY